MLCSIINEIYCGFFGVSCSTEIRDYAFAKVRMPHSFAYAKRYARFRLVVSRIGVWEKQLLGHAQDRYILRN